LVYSLRCVHQSI